jgi:probable F420-dependent oxidoreductase
MTTEALRRVRDRLGRVGIWTTELGARPMAEVRDAVAQLEVLGYRSLWVPEGGGRECFSNVAQLLAASYRIVVGSGIASIHARTAHAMHAGWLNLSESFPGRFLLGLGVSHPNLVTGLHGGTFRAPVATMRAYLDAMDAAVYESPAPQVAPVRVLAALGPQMLDLAAGRTDGAHPYLVTPEHTAAARARLGPDRLLVPEQAAVLDLDRAEALAVARRHVGRHLGFAGYVDHFRRLGWSEDHFADHGSVALLDAMVAMGHVDTILTRVRAHLDAGADCVVVQVLPATGGTIPRDEWTRLAPAFAESFTPKASSG